MKRRADSSKWTLPLAVACLAAWPVPADAGVWLKAQVHYPVPTIDVGNEQPGVDAGLSFTSMANNAGLGFDIIYHYWPASPAYTAAFDRYLRMNRFETLAGSDWAFTALQMTVHGKLAVPVSERLSPWAQIGFGFYRLDWNLDQRRPEGTYAWVEGPVAGNTGNVPGFYAQLGFDWKISPGIAIGLDGTYHTLVSQGEGWASGTKLPNFSALTAGTYIQFGWIRR